MDVDMSSEPENRVRSGEAAEAYRRLRSTVKFAEGDTPIRSVLVVDVDRPEQSEVARRLAGAFARAGDNCAFVDASLRNASAGDQPGFTDLIACQAPVGEIVHLDDADGCRVVGPGSIPDPDLLAGQRLDRALDALLEQHDYVVLSSDSLPEYGDAIALAPRLDAVILTVTQGVSRRPQTVSARDSLTRVGARLLGIVMIEPSKRRFR